MKKRVTIAALMFLLLILAGTACADGPPLEANGGSVSFYGQAGEYYTGCPLVVRESGKVTITLRFGGGVGQFAVLTEDLRCAILEDLYAETRSLYLHPGTYWISVYTARAGKLVELSSRFEPIAADVEPNDSVEQAINITLPYNARGMMGLYEDRDFYRFKLDKRRGLRFEVVCDDKSYYPGLYLLPEIDVVMQNLLGKSPVVLEKGEHCLMVRHGQYSYQSGEATTTPYTLRIETFQPVNKLTLRPGAARLEIGEKLTLKATASPASHGDTLVYASSDPSVATVDAQGVVTAVAPGETIVTCSAAGGIQKESVVTVLKPQATVYSLPKTFRATRGFSYSMSQWVNVPDGQRMPEDLTWSSANRAVASISKKGVLACKKTGSVKITAQNPAGKRYTTTLTVIPNQWKRSKPKGERGYITCYPKLMRYEGDKLYIEMYLYNLTKYNVRTSILGYIFELYDLSKNANVPIMTQGFDRKEMRIPKGKWKVFKVTLDRKPYDNCDLGLGQLYPLVYPVGGYQAYKRMIDLPIAPLRLGMDPARKDQPSDFM